MMAIEFFTLSISARAGKSDRFKSEHPLSGSEGIDNLLRCTDSSKGRSFEITIT